MSGPSERAIAAARVAPLDDWDIAHALYAAHDPALGLDRSVCLRDVVDALNDCHTNSVRLRGGMAAAHFVERTFGQAP